VNSSPPATPSELPYSPRLRTALVLVGTGTAGAYHAGVLRAIHEAGVKIDVVAGRGAGAIGALFAAVDAAARLWEPSGLWRSGAAAGFYRWRASWWLAAAVAAASLAVVLAPLILLAAAAAIALPLGFALQLAGLEAGGAVLGWYDALLRASLSPGALPTVLPRVAAVILAAGLVALVLLNRRRNSGPSRREAGPIWWRLAPAPLDAEGAVRRVSAALWHLIRGVAPLAEPPATELSRRYMELLGENLGQPGFRELLLIAHDVDARRDVLFAALGATYRPVFARRFARDAGGAAGPELSRGASPEPGRGAEWIDLGGTGRDHAIDGLVGALCPPLLVDPHLMTFAAESFWRGETHRLSDRPEALGRLLDELAAAGVDQVILVSPVSDATGPHRLSAVPRDARRRAGDRLASAEAAALTDAVGARRTLFHGIFRIVPGHNPLGPFDFRGCYDERSDRRHSLAELVDRGYEDAYRQFIEPVVGASGERLKIAEPKLEDSRI
jgi:hypothetical protein